MTRNRGDDARDPAAELEGSDPQGTGAAYPPDGADPDLAQHPEFQALRREVEDLRERYQRALADQENARKRHQREMQEIRQYGVSELARDLLDVVDNLERALAGVPEAERGGPLATGVQLVLDQLIQVLHKHGVRAIDAHHQPFDPAWHSAFAEDPRDDVAPGTITEEFMKGYRIGDRLLRAAMVKVAKALPAPEESEARD